MTIDLGFASLTLPDGTPAGVIDVPGHEKFLKNMLAGAAGIDVVLLVIAADESVMPQTREHFDILRLLNVSAGVIALTKSDMVEREWLEAVKDDIRDYVKGSFLENAPILPVDSVKGKGIPELKKALLSAVSRFEARNVDLPFRLPVDRVFSKQGFGAIITGTVVAGSVAVGDILGLLPGDLPVRVRGLQSHGKKQQRIEAGTRAAINLAGIDNDAIERGTVLAAAGAVQTTLLMDCNLEMLSTAEKSLKHRARVRLHIGSAEVLGRIHLIGTEQLEAGAEGFAQFRAETPIACARGDRFVLGAYSPSRTIGGGSILDTAPIRYRRIDEETVARLQRRLEGSPEDILETKLISAPLGMTRTTLTQSSGFNPTETQSALDALRDSGTIFKLDGDRWIHLSSLTALTNRAIETVEDYHRAHPLHTGMPKEELRSSLSKNIDTRMIGGLISHWASLELLSLDGALVRRTGFQVTLSEKQQASLNQVLRIMVDAGFLSPGIGELASELRMPIEPMAALVRVGRDRGLIVKFSEELHYHQKTIDSAVETIKRIVGEHGSVTVAQFRDATGATRKYSLPLLEYFDSIGLTVRIGDARVLKP